jgi:exodeoxyribonuclease V beta subunit
MSKLHSYKDFDAATVPLEGSNLIEASAGTGKTYSIAILVLRLVLEKRLPVKDILMVTFTKAAVAELEERIRLFIRSAYKASLGKEIQDANIAALVEKAIAVETDGSRAVSAQGATKGEQTVQLLREAVLFLDETSVLTIHSFCQQTLGEFAFETNQLFGAEMVPDISPIIEAELNRFWRRHVTTLQAGLLEKIWYEGMKDDIQRLLREHLSGKLYLGFDEKGDYAITPVTQKKWLRQLTELEEKEDQLKEELYAYVTTHNVRLKDTCDGNTYAKKSLSGLIGTPQDFVREVANKRGTGYIVKLFADILERIDTWNSVSEEKVGLLQAIRRQLNGLAIKEAGEGVKVFKERNNMLGYDDLIGNLHSALVKRENIPLEEALRQKYKAVFVDEFQDTDRQQFEIFDKAFGQNTILFYIGDPKQSIYAWRKADIFTYFQARSGVQQVYTMNRNFRSSADFIEAMNRFFLPAKDFDTFYFKGEGDAIEYIPVESPDKNTKGSFYNNTVRESSISIRFLPKKEDIAPSVAAQVAQLLLDKAYQIHTAKGPGQSDKDSGQPAKDPCKRSLLPSDIGILVRTGREGKDIKAALSRLGIPAVTLDDSKVLQSEEARYLLYLLEALESPVRTSINRALLSPFTAYTINDILLLDDEAALTLFSKYRSRWHDDGIYTALMDFVADFGVRHVLLQSRTENGERIITNFFQLAELVHQIESRKSLSMAEVISWLKRNIDGLSTEGDEYTQRVESDEEAVKIVTIHKSKGLEYNIVLAPFLDFNTGDRFEFVSFRDPGSGVYVGAEKDRLTEEQRTWQQQQAEQENRRLLYVALTRAVYKCYIFRNAKQKVSTLSIFTEALKDAPPALIQFEEGEVPELTAGYRIRQTPGPAIPARSVRFSLLQENWRRVSYTMLAAKPVHVQRPRPIPIEDEYDTFIFHTLRRGAKTGSLLHFIFENVHFSDDSRWEKWLEEGIRRFAPGQRELYLPMLQRMLKEVLHTRIQIEGEDFTLSAVGRNKRITEFEFDFPVPVFLASDLNALSNAQLSIIVKDPRELGARQLEGIMNGKMDLFFEQGGRYYILDWKSNYLGSSPGDYAPLPLEEAMRENNYHLQYLIYTLAAKKYLETRLPGFDYATQFGGVIYFFVRGARSGSSNSIYTIKPGLEKIEELEEIFHSKAGSSS